jgi:hypothetical protein
LLSEYKFVILHAAGKSPFAILKRVLAISLKTNKKPSLALKSNNQQTKGRTLIYIQQLGNNKQQLMLFKLFKIIVIGLISRTQICGRSRPVICTAANFFHACPKAFV